MLSFVSKVDVFFVVVVLILSLGKVTEISICYICDERTKCKRTRDPIIHHCTISNPQNKFLSLVSEAH